MAVKKKSPCDQAKSLIGDVRKKIRGGLKDLEKGQPRSASTKLYSAATMIAISKGILKNRGRLYWEGIGTDVKRVSMQLVRPSTMHWPKWKDVTKAILQAVDHAKKRVDLDCGPTK